METLILNRVKGTLIQMWKIVLHRSPYRNSAFSWKLCIFNPHIFGLLMLEICHLSLKYSLLFNMFNSFNVNLEKFQTIYRTNILRTNISWKASFFWEVWNCFWWRMISPKWSKKLLIYNIKKSVWPLALDFPADTSHKSVLALEV